VAGGGVVVGGVVVVGISTHASFSQCCPVEHGTIAKTPMLGVQMAKLWVEYGSQIGLLQVQAATSDKHSTVSEPLIAPQFWNRTQSQKNNLYDNIIKADSGNI